MGLRRMIAVVLLASVALAASADDIVPPSTPAAELTKPAPKEVVLWSPQPRNPAWMYLSEELGRSPSGRKHLKVRSSAAQGFLDARAELEPRLGSVRWVVDEPVGGEAAMRLNVWRGGAKQPGAQVLVLDESQSVALTKDWIEEALAGREHALVLFSSDLSPELVKIRESMQSIPQLSGLVSYLGIQSGTMQVDIQDLLSVRSPEPGVVVILSEDARAGHLLEAVGKMRTRPRILVAGCHVAWREAIKSGSAEAWLHPDMEMTARLVGADLEIPAEGLISTVPWKLEKVGDPGPSRQEEEARPIR